MIEKKGKNEKSGSVEYDMEEDELGIEQYLRPRRYRTRFWMWVILTVIFLLLAYTYKSCIIDKTIPPEELVTSMKIFNINSQWVESEKIDTPEFKGIVLVPEITFRVRNIGKKDLSLVYMLGVFRLLNRPKALGEDYYMAFKDNLKPGQESETIKLRCKFGYRATSKKAFNKHSKDWRSSLVEIYVKSGTSGLSFLESFYISRKIEGMDIEIKVTDKPVSEINEEMKK
jgi:hypothetical protein